MGIDALGALRGNLAFVLNRLCDVEERRGEEKRGEEKGEESRAEQRRGEESPDIPERPFYFFQMVVGPEQQVLGMGLFHRQLTLEAGR